MSVAAPSLFVTVVDRIAVVKITGRANFASSVNFKTLLLELSDRGYNRYILELGQCVTMDSTFLGVLAGLALKFGNSGPAQESSIQSNHSAGLELLNPNQRVLDLLDNLGVAHLFQVQHCSPPAEAAVEKPVDGPEPSREQLSETCLEAHKLLMQINPSNIPKFKEVTQFLMEDLKKLKNGNDQ